MYNVCTEVVRAVHGVAVATAAAAERLVKEPFKNIEECCFIFYFFSLIAGRRRDSTLLEV